MEWVGGFNQWGSVTQFLTGLGGVILTVVVLLYLIQLLYCIYQIVEDSRHMRGVQEMLLREQEWTNKFLQEILMDMRQDQIKKDKDI